MNKEPFFTKDPRFFKTFFSMMLLVALQNLVAYSVNMLDNIMLGSYSQDALSGAAAVNQIFFLVQQLAIALGNSLAVLAAQYWGKNEPGPIRTLTGLVLKAALAAGVAMVVLCSLFPRPILAFFTQSQAIRQQGEAYLSIIQWTFLLFLLSNTLLSALRSVKTVHIAFWISLVSLVVNGGVNYVLIFGKLGFPSLGIRGAAIGTLISRVLELAIVLIYLLKYDKKLTLFSQFRGAHGLLTASLPLRKAFIRVSIPLITGAMVWAIAGPIQTAILGQLSDDAIAANSVSITFYQYLKVVLVAVASTSSVMVGNTIGAGDLCRLRMETRTMSVMDLTIGVIMGLLLFVLRKPLLSMYDLTDTAYRLALNFMAIMSVIMVGMSYQMSVINGIIQGGGDAKFTMVTNLISVWGIVIPLSLLAAFRWHWPVELVVLALQSDQLFKCIPAFFRYRSYKWIKNLTVS